MLPVSFDARIIRRIVYAVLAKDHSSTTGPLDCKARFGLPRRREKRGILNGHFIVERGAFSSESFHDVHVVIVVIAISPQPRLGVKVNDVYNERVALPMSGRVAIGKRVLIRVVSATDRNDPKIGRASCREGEW